MILTSILLSKLIENIGEAVQKANHVIEESAANSYLEQGYIIKSEEPEKSDHGSEICTPISFTLQLPAASGRIKQINVPVTALLHNTSLRLEDVEVKLKFVIEEADDTIAVAVKPENNDQATLPYSELTLQFKNVPPPEGIARITQKHLQSL